MAPDNSEARIEELRRLVQEGKYQTDPLLVASALVDEALASNASADDDQPERPEKSAAATPGSGL